jgi:hypothetical protein
MVCLSESGESARDPRPDSADGTVEDLGNLLLREIIVIAEDNYFALVVG